MSTWKQFREFNNGDKFDGDFDAAGRIHGPCTYKWKVGKKLHGSMLHISSYNRLSRGDKSAEYSGDNVGGKHHGEGKKTFVTGDVYVSLFQCKVDQVSSIQFERH